MRRSTKQVIAVMVVTTVLCADQIAPGAPAPANRTQAQRLARSLASRLTVTLRQAVTATRLQPARRDGETSTIAPGRVRNVAPCVHATLLSPFQFRLPPPSL